jgi:hypothetical protein
MLVAVAVVWVMIATCHFGQRTGIVAVPSVCKRCTVSDGLLHYNVREGLRMHRDAGCGSARWFTDTLVGERAVCGTK